MQSLPPLLFKSEEPNSGYAPFFNSDLFSDLVVVAPDGRRFNCHRVVLAARCPRFAATLAAPIAGAASHGCEELPVTGIDADALEAVLRFAYEGAALLTPSNAVAVYDAAARLQVRALAGAARGYARRVIAGATAVAMLAEALKFEVDELVEEATACAVLNFEEAFSCPDYLSAPHTVALRLLEAAKASGLHPGRSLFKAAWRWLTAAAAHVEHLEKVLCAVATPDLGISDLLAVAGVDLAALCGGGGGLGAALLQQQKQQVAQQQRQEQQGEREEATEEQQAAQRRKQQAQQERPVMALGGRSGSGDISGNGGDEALAAPPPLPTALLGSQPALGPMFPPPLAAPPLVTPPPLLPLLGGAPLGQLPPELLASLSPAQLPAVLGTLLRGGPGGVAAVHEHLAGMLSAGMDGGAAMDLTSVPQLPSPQPSVLALPLGLQPLQQHQQRGAAQLPLALQLQPQQAANLRGGAGPAAAPAAAAAALPRAALGALTPGAGSATPDATGASTSQLPPPVLASRMPQMRTPVISMPGQHQRALGLKGVCQVDGCYGDLSGLRDYHQRYKVCEYHLKVPTLMRDSIPQRFCQQCGRFHPLDEFDGNKRSCRSRLLKHNARRRKREGPESGGARGRGSPEYDDAPPARRARPEDAGGGGGGGGGGYDQAEAASALGMLAAAVAQSGAGPSVTTPAATTPYTRAASCRPAAQPSELQAMLKTLLGLEPARPATGAAAPAAAGARAGALEAERTPSPPAVAPPLAVTGGGGDGSGSGGGDGTGPDPAVGVGVGAQKGSSSDTNEAALA
ncbi:hypothetical protein Rsub_04035 [Raphidocelis subcapitata]|uniref:SBP-type domain-containing protein n=1 Tax=Raphidocelis subcapitata TaxID=307507 RepID=A0A2V0NVS1_9CHLO|nr:hypothetical protein Rsub_04035 [Raphidocelis subcapitata]|eukprot:GBF91731.1 hypothetical protein Rsub_04035 [Raphidocelis subcapitata]